MVAADLAPAIEEMASPKESNKVGLWKRAKSLVGLRKDLREASADLLDDQCDIDEPEVCEEAEGKLRGLIAKTLRFWTRGDATEKELESAEAALTSGDSMEDGLAEPRAGLGAEADARGLGLPRVVRHQGRQGRQDEGNRCGGVCGEDGRG